MKKNLVFYLSYQASRFIFPVILTPYLAHALEPSGFADFVIWNSCVWTTTLVMEFGFYIYGVTRMALAENRDEHEAILGGIMASKVILAPFAVAAYFAVALLLGLANRQPVAVGVGVIALLAYGTSFAWYFQGQQRGGVAVFLDLIPQLVQFALVFLLVSNASQTWLVASLQTGAALGTVVASIVMLRRDAVRLTLRWAAIPQYLRSATPYFIERASYTLYATSTPIILAALTSAREAAYYGLAEKVNIILTAVIGPLSQAATPVVVRKVRQVCPDWSLSIWLISSTTILVIVCAIGTFFAIGPIIGFFLDESYMRAVTVAQWFCLVAVLMTIQLTTANFVIIPAGLNTEFVKASLIGLVCSIVLQFFLVPLFGAPGSVMARVVAEGVIMSYFLVLIFRLCCRQRS